MASLVTNQYIYIHIPKTGGIWSSKIIKEINNGEASNFGGINQFGTRFHSSLFDIRQEAEVKNSICFVRNPIDWYESLFRFTKKTEFRFRPFNRMNKECMFDEFVDFSVNCFSMIDRINYQAGWPIQTTSVGKYENLRQDLFDFLSVYHHPFLLDETMSSIPAMNVSRNERPTITKIIREKIISRELPIFEQYYPEEL